jgi:hypothetical protein
VGWVQGDFCKLAYAVGVEGRELLEELALFGGCETVVECEHVLLFGSFVLLSELLELFSGGFGVVVIAVAALDLAQEVLDDGGHVECGLIMTDERKKGKLNGIVLVIENEKKKRNKERNARKESFCR